MHRTDKNTARLEAWGYARSELEAIDCTFDESGIDLRKQFQDWDLSVDQAKWKGSRIEHDKRGRFFYTDPAGKKLPYTGAIFEMCYNVEQGGT